MRQISMPGAQEHRVPGSYLMLTATVSGAAVMMIEVLGSRVIGPFFGASLFVWTALITVTLVALSAGYAVGGWFSDRRRDPAWLYVLIAVAALAVVLIPAARSIVVRACMPLGLRAGSLTATILLFGPALFLLGFVSPYVVRLAVRELETVGRTVGRLSALSTVGSFAGTVITGFYLIGAIGTDRIFVLIAALLGMLSAGYALLRSRCFGLIALAIAACAAGLLWPGDEVAAPRTLADGTQVRLIDRIEGNHGQIKIIDYRYGNRHHRELVIDGLIQTGIDLATGESIYEYSYVLGLLARAAHPQGSKALVVGLGAGAVPLWLGQRGVSSDVVEIDPAVIAAARKHMGFEPSGRVVTGDARFFFETDRARYDYVVMDAFTGDSTPQHLLSVEALRALRSRLYASGIALFNFHGSLGDDKRMTMAFLRTLKEVFASVDVYPVFSPERGETWGNIVFVARQTTAPYPAPRPARSEIHPLVVDEVLATIAKPHDVAPARDVPLLTDDYNPIDLVDLALKERVRRSVLDHTDSVLLAR